VRSRRRRGIIAGMLSATLVVLGVGIGVAAPAAGPAGAVPSAAASATQECSYSPIAQGYLQATALGDVLASGNATLHGTLMNQTINQAVVGMAETPSGAGYWEVAADGGIFAFGDAGFHGSMGGVRLNRPIVGMAATPTGAGYWEVASDGGIFAFGDAGFYGSMGGVQLAAPITGMAATSSGLGYRFTGADGGVFAFGDATFQGTFAGGPLPARVIGLVSVPAGGAFNPPLVPTNLGGPSTFFGADYYYAGAEQGLFYGAAGASVQLCAAQQTRPSTNFHTVTELSVQFDISGQNVIEIGLDASPQDFGTSAPTVFVSRSTAGAFYPCGGFQNQIHTCGYVQVSPFVSPNVPAPIGVTVSYAVVHAEQRWNLYENGQLMGYFPDSLWGGAFTRTQYVQAFGEVATHPGEVPDLIMGNGLYGHQAGADRVTGYQLFGSGSQPAAFTGFYESVPASYDIAGNSTSFAYGGPGGFRATPIPPPAPRVTQHRPEPHGNSSDLPDISRRLFANR
jgi:hypothetical protein